MLYYRYSDNSIQHDLEWSGHAVTEEEIKSMLKKHSEYIILSEKIKEEMEDENLSMDDMLEDEDTFWNSVDYLMEEQILKPHPDEDFWSFRGFGKDGVVCDSAPSLMYSGAQYLYILTGHQENLTDFFIDDGVYISDPEIILQIDQENNPQLLKKFWEIYEESMKLHEDDEILKEKLELLHLF